jgi:putative transposase
MIKSHKIELKPNKSQLTYLSQSAGTARFAYNWALSQWKNDYECYQKHPFSCSISPASTRYEGELRKRLNSIKKQDFPWMYNVSKYAPQQAIKNLGAAFVNFFAKRAQFPKFKNKYHHDSFEIGNDQLKVDGRYLIIPKLKPIKMKESLRFNGSIKTAVLSRTAGKWFVSLSIEVDDESIVHSKNHAIGIDLGIKAFATYFDGVKHWNSPTLKPYRILQNRIKVLSRQLSRKEEGSNNRYKARVKLAKLHSRIANIRKDYLHKLTHFLTNNYSIIGIETLDVKAMSKNRLLSKSILDAGFYEFSRQLQYKSNLYESTIVKADKFYPSTKLCSKCNYKLATLSLSVRSWTCPSCNTHHDRDENASTNLYNYAVSSTVKACREMV